MISTKSLLYLSFALTTPAIYVPLDSRTNDPHAEIQEHMGNALLGATADRAAGIGAEFETLEFLLKNTKCSKADTDKLKRTNIGGRKGKDWELTADTTSEAGVLHAEYILDGTKVKVGSGEAAKAAAGVAKDFDAWSPWKNNANSVKVGTGKCDPWKLEGASAKLDAAKVQWDAQVTMPMPLEALYDLMEDQVQDIKTNRNILSGLENSLTGPRANGGRNLVLVTKDYFQSSPNGIVASKVTNDVLGFCSLVLSYAKAAGQLRQGESPKLMTTFMPRTEFNTIFKQVKQKLPGILFTLFNTLACYKTVWNSKLKKFEVALDEDFCAGTTKKPVPKKKLQEAKFTNPTTSFNIKTWIDEMSTGKAENDALTNFDQSIDHSIGGLGSATEKVFNTQREVPLFEFRELPELPYTSELETFMSKVVEAVQKLHKTFAVAP